jgi:hypothetical protein
VEPAGQAVKGVQAVALAVVLKLPSGQSLQLLSVVAFPAANRN